MRAVSLCLVVVSLFSFLPSPNYVGEAHRGNDPTFSSTIEPGLFYPKALFMGDIGLSASTPYTGRGVKAGIIDSPISLRDVTILHHDETDAGLDYVINRENDVDHGTRVYDVLSSVAPEAEYFSTFKVDSSSFGDRDFLDCAVELANYANVDLINDSSGGPGDISDEDNSGEGLQGTYASRASAGIDQLSASSGVVLFNSTGNRGDILCTTSAATGLSAIGVTASSRSSTLSNVGIHKLKDEYESKILPYFCSAPGEPLYGIAAARSTYIDPTDVTSDSFDPTSFPNYTGTSFSAPLATGIGALILEEFPALKNNPIALKTVLYCSTYRNLINYQFARLAGQNSVVFDIPADAQDGQQFFSADIRVPKGYVLRAASGVRYDAFNISIGQANTAIDPNSIAYSQLDLKIYGNPTLDTRLVTGLKNANMTSVSFKNASPSDTTYRLTATLSGDKAIGRSERPPSAITSPPTPRPRSR